MKVVTRPPTDEERADIELVYPNVPAKHTKTIERCETFVGAVFQEIERLHGEEAARKIFAPYGRQLTAHDKTRDDDARLLWRYYGMPKRNKRALAKALVKERRKETFEAALRWIKLLTNPKEKRARAAHGAYELLRDKLWDYALRVAEEKETGTDNL